MLGEDRTKKPVTHKDWYEANLQHAQSIKEMQKILLTLKEGQQKEIQLAIKENVNGKIDKLTRMVESYIEDDNEWKNRYQPYMDGITYATGGAKILVWISVGVSAVVGAILAIRSLFR